MSAHQTWLGRDLGVKVFDLFFINLRCLPPAALEYAGRTFKQSALPLMDHRRMNPEPTGQLADRLLALQRFQRDFGLKLWVMLLPFRHRRSPSC
jgi:hypothetical protein